jgi:DNA modification methylase
MSTPYYADDAVTLYHGDCREVTAWLEADVLVTDPPYGIAWRAGGLHSTRGIRQNATQSIVSDEDTSARDDVLTAWGDRPAVVFGSWRKARPSGTTHRLIWHKKGRHPGVSPAAIFPNDEEIYLVGAGWVGKPMASVMTTSEQRALQPSIIGHPTPKPVGLMQRLIIKCPPGVIADPFAGSGATLLAARAEGRKSIGVEIDESYCELIAKRLSQGVLDFGATA